MYKPSSSFVIIFLSSGSSLFYLLAKSFYKSVGLKSSTNERYFFSWYEKISYLIITRWFPGVNKYWRTNHWANNILRYLTLFLVSENNNKQMEFGSFIVVRSWTKSKTVKWSAAFLKFNMILSFDSNVL